MDIKCKLCKASFEIAEELNDHWEGLHNEEWRKLQEQLKEGMDRKEQTHLEVSNEGMKTLADGRSQARWWTRGGHVVNKVGPK